MAVVTPTPSWNTTRVYGTWRTQAGGMRPGTYKVTIPVRVTSAVDDVIIPAGVFTTGNLNVTPGSPSLDIQVPCSDDGDIAPTGWQVTIEISFADAAGEKYVVDTFVGVPVNLRTVVLAQSIPVPVTVLYRGVPGGLAELDADGDVVDASGAKVTGGGGGTTTVDGLTDMTTVGRAVAKAVDKPAARAAIDAADITATNAALATKADATATANSLAAKADATTTSNALALKAPLASPTFTGTVSGVTKGMVGLGNVDNTADIDKPVSTAQAAALAARAPLASPTFTGTVSGITKSMVGLPNVDNTADVSKPVSTAQAAALATKVPTTWGIRPRIAADSATTVPVRATWISSNASGYVGPVDWDLTLYLDHPGNTPTGQPAAQYQSGDGVYGRTSS